MILYPNDIIVYKPKETEYIVKEMLKIKQDNGDWKDGISYYNKEEPNQVYVRTLEQLEKFELK